jgi:hypothetical protein
MRALICLLVIAATAGQALADDPWARGVSAANQAKANALFAEGNQLFAQQAHAAALAKYEAAVALWDHPLIRFNIAVTEIRLDRILDAAKDLEAALRFDQAPFTAELYRQAMDYQTLVAGRVGDIEASCDQPDVAILLDGKPWFTCPGNRKQRVLAGEHVIVGERSGFMTTSRRVSVGGAKVANEQIALLPIESVIKLRYPSPRWLPWTVAGGGVAIGLGGLGFWFAGRNQMDRFNAQYAKQCPTGCDSDFSDPGLAALKDQGDGAVLKGKIAVTMMVGGGAIAAGGIVWVILNRPTRELPKVEVLPTASGAAARATWRF